MYYKILSPKYNSKKLASFLAERINSTNRILIVSEDPELVLDMFSSAWKEQYTQYSAERENENDTNYIAALTDLISLMQRVNIAMYNEFSNAQFVVVSPDKLETDLTSEYQILVCCDNKSLKIYRQIIKSIAASYSLVVAFGPNDQLNEYLQKAGIADIKRSSADINRALKRQKLLLSGQGFDLDDPNLNCTSVASAIIKKNSIEFMSDFLHNQTEISSLRTISGRARSQKDLSSPALKNLKILTKLISPPDRSHSDWQLFDDPLS